MEAILHQAKQIFPPNLYHQFQECAFTLDTLVTIQPKHIRLFFSALDASELMHVADFIENVQRQLVIQKVLINTYSLLSVSFSLSIYIYTLCSHFDMILFTNFAVVCRFA
jgi:hypothetical protein